jgi:hypothetical protein
LIVGSGLAIQSSGGKKQKQLGVKKKSDKNQKLTVISIQTIIIIDNFPARYIDTAWSLVDLQ